MGVDRLDIHAMQGKTREREAAREDQGKKKKKEQAKKGYSQCNASPLRSAGIMIPRSLAFNVTLFLVFPSLGYFILFWGFLLFLNYSLAFHHDAGSELTGRAPWA
jgi:hypothetical protein